MLFRKPIDARTVADNLRKWKTGGLRRLSIDKPLPDAIPSGRTPDREESISSHPCLKPQHFMRIIVRALLPLGEGTVLDPFMGSGSTIAAAEAIGYHSLGVELDADYFKQAESSIPRLAALYPDFKGQDLQMSGEYGPVERDDTRQLAMAFAEKSPAYMTKRSARPRRNGLSC
jgi:DNA modification methylase